MKLKYLQGKSKTKKEQNQSNNGPQMWNADFCEPNDGISLFEENEAEDKTTNTTVPEGIYNDRKRTLEIINQHEINNRKQES